MSREILIIGAGQSGLQLGIGLVQKGYHVTVITDKTPAEITDGFPTSSQGMFATALSYERELGLDFWQNSSPKNTSVTFSLADENFQKPNLYWQGIVEDPYVSIDQRLKFPKWMDTFQKLGGELLFEKINLENIEKYARKKDLILFATGKGDISKVFKRDETKSPFEKPMRKLALTYVKNIRPESMPGVHFNVIPGIGEYFIMPGLTLNGYCEMMLFEAIPESPFDCWDAIENCEEQLEQSLALLKKYIPWEAERCQYAELSSSKATLRGHYAPIVNHPILTLNNNKIALGMGDAVILNDPIAGQGANNASKCAKIYLDAILKNENKPFDEIWMRKTFNCYWESYAKFATLWSNLLLGESAEHIKALLFQASQHQIIANYLANAFDDPKLFFPWVLNAQKTEKLINKLLSRESIENTKIQKAA